MTRAEKGEQASEGDLDPRLRAAETMSARLVNHPGASPGIRRLSEELVEALRRATHDEGVVRSVLRPPEGREDDDAPPKAVRDALDRLEAQASDLLAALAALHSAVVRRDARTSDRVLADATRTLSELDAMADVTRMLGDEE